LACKDAAVAIKRCPRCASQYPLSATTCPDCAVALEEVMAGDVDLDASSLASSAGSSTIGEAIDSRSGLTASTGAGPRPTRAVVADDDAEGEGDDGDGDQPDDDGDQPDDDADESGAGEHVTYEMGEWSNEARVMLEQLLTGAGITRVWEGTDLVVRSEDEQVVDDLVDEVRSADEPMLDPDAEKVVYEVNDWTTEQLVTLTGGLMERGIGYEFDMEGDLVVLATDEEGVEALLDVIEFGPDSDGADTVGTDANPADDVAAALAGSESADEGDPDDGLETAEILSDLFVACDRLQKNARDADGVLGVVNSAEKLSTRALPFGYEPTVWEGMVDAATGLSDDLAGDEVDDDELEDKARALRDRLRNYV
jgi:hypothetical protein